MEFSRLCVTLDIWSDKIRHLHYLGATCHYLDRNIENGNLQLHSKAMSLKVLDAEDEKNAENVHAAVINVMLEYDLYSSLDKIVFVSDRGPDIKAALHGHERNFCLSHLLNNTVQNACDGIIDRITSNVSRIVKYMKVTGLNTKLTKCLISYVSTRWNTRYDMFESFLAVYSEIVPIMKDKKIENLFKRIKVENVEAICCYLKPYKLLTQEIEGDKEVTSTKILPCIEMLRSHNSIGFNEHHMVEQMKRAANTYIENNVMHHLPKDHQIWAFFNPLTKRMSGFKTVNRDEIVKEITASIAHFPVQNENGERVRQQTGSIFECVYDTEVDDRAAIDSEIEVSRYMNFPVSIYMIFPVLFIDFIEISIHCIWRR